MNIFHRALPDSYENSLWHENGDNYNPDESTCTEDSNDDRESSRRHYDEITRRLESYSDMDYHVSEFYASEGNSSRYTSSPDSRNNSSLWIRDTERNSKSPGECLYCNRNSRITLV